MSESSAASGQKRGRAGPPSPEGDASKRPRLSPSPRDTAPAPTTTGDRSDAPASLDPQCAPHLSAERTLLSLADGSLHRHVSPYMHTHECHAKGRWVGKRLLQVFCSEFRSHDQAYFEAAIAGGALRVNGHRVAADYVLKDLDRVEHTLHRHEPDITAAPIEILYEDERLVVVNKPAGMQVHPAGAFHYNTLLSILVAEHGYQWLSPLHRLDRLTSGVMMLGAAAGYKTRPTTGPVTPKHVAVGMCAGAAPAPAQVLKQIAENTVRKFYVARVQGKFPEAHSAIEIPALDAPATSPELEGEPQDVVEHKAGKVVWRVDGPGEGTWLEIDAPIRVVDHRNAVSGVADAGSTVKGKECRTHVRRLAYDSATNESVLEVVPLSGRTHQIRVHLAWLGYPIANDPVYRPAALAALTRAATLSRGEADLGAGGAPLAAESLPADDCRRWCVSCTRGIQCEFNIMQRMSEGIFLHAFRYQGLESVKGKVAWEFGAPLPAWAAV